jgi:hypothetical protein
LTLPDNQQNIVYFILVTIKHFKLSITPVFALHFLTLIHFGTAYYTKTLLLN